MAMVVVDDSCLQADSQPKSGALVWGSAAACALFYSSSNEPSELSQWPCGHDDSTRNIVLVLLLLLLLLLNCYCALGLVAGDEVVW